MAEVNVNENANATVNNEAPVNEEQNNAATQQQAQPNATAEEPKKKRKMPGWLKYVLAGLGGTALGAGIVTLVRHFTGVDTTDAVQAVAQTVQQPTIAAAPQPALVDTAVHATAEAVKTASGQQ